MNVASIVSVVIALGALHGLVLSAILWTTRRGLHEANRILALIIALTSVNMLDAMFLYHRVYLRLPHLLLIADPSVLLLGPLCLAYCRVISGRPSWRRWGGLPHFLPAIALWLAYLPFYLQDGAAKAARIEDFLLYPPPPFFVIQILRYLQTIVYMLWSMRVIQARIRDRRAQNEGERAPWEQWPRFMIAFGAVMWLTSLLLFQTRPDRFNESIVQLMAALLLFTIGYIAILNPDFLYSLRGDGPSGKKYEKSALRGDALEAIYLRLVEHMEKQAPFRSPDLNLQQLAEALGVPTHHLSQVINEKGGRNFYRFLNAYRIEEAQRRLRDPLRCREKLVTVAFDSGFNSLATFNRVFKELTGRSPSAFRRRPS